MQNLKRQVALGWLWDGRNRIAFPIRRCLTEPGQVETGKVAREAEGRRQGRLELGRCKVQEPVCRALGKRGMDSFADRTIKKSALGGRGFSNVEVALGCEVEFKRHEQLTGSKSEEDLD